VAAQLLFLVLNWQQIFQTCPLLQVTDGKGMADEGSVLAGADAGFGFRSLISPVGCCRGVF
jgi:hypothetical protein